MNELHAKCIVTKDYFKTRWVNAGQFASACLILNRPCNTMYQEQTLDCQGHAGEGC
ncbi:MAG: hypothetical protein JWM28_169, partial [Chitinophagaceae bacterium]|nr:hypothetical protein [Chitinophagaceae bacterium]